MNSANSAALDDDGDKENNMDTSVCASREADQGTLPHPQPGVWTHMRAYRTNLFGTSKESGVENSTNCCLLCSLLFCRDELLTIYVFYLNLKMKCVSPYPIHISAMKLKLL